MALSVNLAVESLLFKGYLNESHAPPQLIYILDHSKSIKW